MLLIIKGVNIKNMADSISGTSSSPVGTSYVADAKTAEKCNIIESKYGKQTADYYRNMFGIPNTSESGGVIATNKTGKQDLDKKAKNIAQTLFAVELKAQKGISQATEAAARGISGANKAITDDIRGIKDSLHDILAPVSSATGQTLGNLTVLRDPLGAPEAIGRSIGHLIDKVNPGFTDRMEATMKKYKADDLSHLGTNVLGGLRSLASTVDALLSVPLSIASDIYNGLMDIMKELSNLLDSVVSGIMDLIFGPKGLLDSILPMDAIKGFLDVVGDIAGVVGSIGGMFGGFTMVTNMASQLGNFSSMGMNTLSNPMALASSFMPPGTTQYSSALRNPQQMLSNIIPPQINQQLGQIGRLPGLGFVGNMGYGIGGTLENMKEGVLSNILGNYSSQLGIIGPLLGKTSGNPSVTNPSESYPPYIAPASTNPKLPVVHGVRVFPNPPPLVLASKDSINNPITSATQSQIPNLNGSVETFKYDNKPTSAAATYSS